MDELEKKQIVPPDTEILRLVKETQDGQVCLELDLSEHFRDYVSTMGSAGEYVVIGGLVNTFLEAYDADCIRITVAGEPFETPHELYSGYLLFYPVQ